MPEPAETLCSVVTYLEMMAKPTAPNLPLPALKIALMRAEQPTLSFYRYLTLFPGLSLAANPRGFVIQCFTSCTHLSEENSCSLYDKEERPVHCQTYDPWSCRYVPTFAQEDPRFRSISKDTWRQLEPLFQMNDEGAITERPDFNSICEVIG